MFNTALKLWQQGLDSLLPQACPSCSAHLPAGSGLAFCATCYSALSWWNPAQHLPPKLPRALNTFQAPLLYEEPFRRSLLAFKFEDATYLAPLLARLLYPTVGAETGAVLVPVPMHTTSLRARTYNHAALLAKELGKLSGLPVDTLSLTRPQQGESQHRQTRAGRLRLTRTSFACSPALCGKTVFLIDDIFTTGATLGACAGALKAAGVTKVHGRTLAYTLP